MIELRPETATLLERARVVNEWNQTWPRVAFEKKIDREVIMGAKAPHFDLMQRESEVIALL